MDTTSQKYITTNQLAERLLVQGATIRRSLCVKGHYMGLRPLKGPNNRLLWPDITVEQIFGQGGIVDGSW